MAPPWINLVVKHAYPRQNKLLDLPKHFDVIDKLGIIIHRYLKASNVLLDSTMNPKISDFGKVNQSGWNIVRTSMYFAYLNLCP